MNARPRIVVLDGHTLNPGDLSWAALEALGDCTIHAHTPPAEAVAARTTPPPTRRMKSRRSMARPFVQS